MLPLAFIISSFLLFGVGAMVGSFLNVVIYRTLYDNSESWMFGRSKCESCSRQIAWYDNVPIVSYLILRARCRWCNQQIELTHPIVEFLTGILFVWWYWAIFVFFNLTQAPLSTLQPLFWLFVGILLLMISIIDALYYIIPDTLVGLLLIGTLCYRVGLTLFGVMQTDDLVKSIIAMVIGVSFIGSLWLITGRKGMGLGDVKLIAPLALLVGWPNIVVVLYSAFVIGAIAGVSMIMMKKKRFGQVIPFGPFLILGTFVALVFGDSLVGWYVGLF